MEKIALPLALVSRASAARPGTQEPHDGSCCASRLFALGPRKSGLPDLRRYLPISGKPEIGVSLRSRKRARSARPGQEIGAHARGPRSRVPGERSETRDPGAARRLATRNILRFAALCAGSRLSLRSRKCARSARPGQEIGAHAQGPRARCTRPGYEIGVTPRPRAGGHGNARRPPACRRRPR